ncbi:MAG: VOC family protein [Pseudomonadota bacterium]
MLNSICPIFPSLDFSETIDFYGLLGFRKSAQYDAEGYLILIRDQVEVHFFRTSDHVPETSNHGAFVRVENANQLSDEFGRLGLPMQGIPWVGKAQDKPWGICELALVDPDGNLLRFGHVIE